MLFADSMVFRAISRIWPVQGSASFSSIFELQCYTLALRLLPATVINLLLGPLLTALVAHNTLSESSSNLILFTTGAVIGVAVLLFWDFPGVAVLNGVSTRRVWAGFVFWLGVVLGIVVVVVLILYPLVA